MVNVAPLLWTRRLGEVCISKMPRPVSSSCRLKQSNMLLNQIILLLGYKRIHHRKIEKNRGYNQTPLGMEVHHGE
jgi:hypothetical protein